MTTVQPADPIARIIGRVAVVLAMLVAVSLPVVYGLSSFQGIGETLEFKARIKASALGGLIASNPDTWEYAENRMQGLIALEPVRVSGEQIRILNARNELLLESGPQPPSPLLRRSYPLFDSGREVGRVEFSVSQRVWAWNTALSALAGAALGLLVFLGIRNIPLRALQKAGAQLAAEQQRATTVLNAIHDAIVMIDAAGVVQRANPAALSLVSATDAAALQNRQFSDFVAPEYRDALRELHRHVIAGATEKIQFQSLDIHGARRWLDLRSVPMVIDDERFHLAVVRDISESKLHEEELQHAAHYDSLTGLPNRVLLADRLRHGMSQATRRDQSLAVVYLDLDGFKTINDNYGHSVGDKVLNTIAARLQNVMRDGDTVARIGGDEFVAVVQDLRSTEEVEPILHRMLSATNNPVPIDDQVFQITGSLGVAIYPQQQAIDADQLMRQADQAMYEAKVAGKNRYKIFNWEIDQQSRLRSERLTHIRQAFQRQEFVLYFQPKVHMREGTVIGMEALIRWQHPQDGLQPPASFLPFIENETISLEIGEWVIATALRQVEAWAAAGVQLPVSVNVSALQLQQPNFASRLAALLAAHPATHPSRLVIEILETSALADMQQVIATIAACNALGVSFSLDDFGTGYSSLTYLRRLDVRELKIDRSFVRDILVHSGDLAILQGVLGLAKSFQHSVVAEGVETVAHGQMLIMAGCELGQGYAIARPMPASEVEHWISQWRPDPLWSTARPMGSDNSDLLGMAVEHRAWVASVEQYVKGKSTHRPTDSHRCRLGIWLDGAGKKTYGHLPAHQEAQSLHAGIHALGERICAQHRASPREDWAADLHTLFQMRDTLIGQLHHFNAASAARAAP